MRVLLVTGLSGAGKSVALKTLEDVGFEAIDNVPLSLIPSLIESGGGPAHSLAIGTDARSRDFSLEHFYAVVQTLRSIKSLTVEILFLSCDSEVLQRRFTETRRKHPLALDRPVSDGIAHERSLLSPLRDIADMVLDTSEWTGNDLRGGLLDYYGSENRELSIFVTSFSFKRGLPRDADLVLDVRFLQNPYYDEAIRHLSGKNKEVGEFIESDPSFASYFDNLTNLITPLLPRYLKEGKSYLTIAIGCTGGIHRSVCVAEKLAGFLRGKEYKVGIRHRDLAVKEDKN